MQDKNMHIVKETKAGELWNVAREQSADKDDKGCPWSYLKPKYYEN